MIASSVSRKVAFVAAGALLSFAVASAQTTQILSTVTRVAGNHTAGNSGNGGLATSAQLSSTTQSAVYDQYGNLYIADGGNLEVRKVDAATGIISVFAGGGTSCVAATDEVGDGCLATQAILVDPVELRIWRGGLYILDQVGQRVRRVDLTTGIISVVLGTGVSAAVTYDKGPDTIVRSPQGIAFNSRGDIFVVQNTAPHIDRIDAVTGLVSNFAGNGSQKKLGDGGISTNAAFDEPIGIAVDSHDNIYVADQANNCIRKITVTSPADLTGTITTFAGPQGTDVTAGFVGDGQTADHALFGKSGLTDLWIDDQDNVYVVDSTNFRIRKITQPAAGASFGIVSTVAGNGVKSAKTGNDGTYGFGSFMFNPYDVTISPAGDLVITDKGTAAVMALRPASIFPTTNFGSTSTQTIWANTATSGTFSINGGADFTVGATSCSAASTPLSGVVCSATITFNPSATGKRMAAAVFTDASNVSVGQPLVGVGGGAAASVLPGIINATAGSATGAAGSTGDNAAATSALLAAPSSAAVDTFGNTYVADTANNTVRRIAVGTGTITRVAGTVGMPGYTGDGAAATAATLNKPSGVAVDGAGNLYIADTGNNVIRRVDAVSGIITTFAGTGTAGYSGDGGVSTLATMNAPMGVAVYNASELYVADTGNNVVRLIGLRSHQIQTYAGTGVAGFAGDVTTPTASTSALLNAPAAVAVGDGGAVYIADTGNQRVREVDATGLIKTIAGVEVAGYSGDGDATLAELSSPDGIAVDASGAVYIADTGNNRVRVLSAGILTTVAGGATSGTSGNGANSGNALLNSPRGIAVDSMGGIVVADTGNNSVRRIDTSMSALAFLPTSPSTSSAPLSVSLLSTGNQALAVTNVAVPAGFMEETSGGTNCNTAALSLPMGTSCTLQLHFAPTALAPYTGNVVVTDNAQGNAASTQTVALTGTGKQVFKFTFTLPNTVAAGTPISVTVMASNPNQTYSGTIHFTSSDPQAVLPADYTFILADNGVHTFTGVQLHTGGTQAITVTDASDSTQSGTATTTVTNGVASKVIVVSGSGQSANIGTAYGSALVAQVLDAYGNPVPGVAVTFTAPASGPHASFGTGATASATVTVISSSLGVVSTSPTALTADKITGSFSVVASGAGLGTSASFSLTNTSTIAAGFTIAPYQPIVGTVLPGAPSSQALTVTPVGGFSATTNFTCSTSDPSTSCSFSPTSLPGTDGTSQTVELTFQTTGPNRTGGSAMLRGTSTVLVCLGVFFIAGRKRRRLIQALALGVLCFVAVSGLSGCSSGPLSQPRTASGSYNVVVTGTSGSITGSTTVQYIVGGD
jgi:sugar lactone lactonase YvrE